VKPEGEAVAEVGGNRREGMGVVIGFASAVVSPLVVGCHRICSSPSSPSSISPSSVPAETLSPSSRAARIARLTGSSVLTLTESRRSWSMPDAEEEVSSASKEVS
jgi:hypothetical protein